MRILTLSQQGIESRDQRLLSGQVERDEARKFLRVDGADGCQRAQHGRIENQNIKRIPAFRHSACKAADAIPIGQVKRRDGGAAPRCMASFLDLFHSSGSAGGAELGRASCRERVCQYVSISLLTVSANITHPLLTNPVLHYIT